MLERPGCASGLKIHPAPVAPVRDIPVARVEMEGPASGSLTVCAAWRRIRLRRDCLERFRFQGFGFQGLGRNIISVLPRHDIYVEAAYLVWHDGVVRAELPRATRGVVSTEDRRIHLAAVEEERPSRGVSRIYTIVEHGSRAL